MSSEVAKPRWRWPAALIAVTALGVAAGYLTRHAAEPSELVDGKAGGQRMASGSAVGREPPKLGQLPRPMAPENPMLAPGSAAYSPAHAAVAAGLDSFQVFEREQRNEAFAGRREQFLREHATEMFARHAPDMRLEDIECRTGSCLATLDAPNNEWSHQMVSAVRWGSRYSKRVSAPEGGRVMIEVAVLMDRELLDHATYERYLTDWRRNSVPDLDYLRASMQDAQGGQ